MFAQNYLVLIIIFIFFGSNYAQTPQFDHFYTNNGLSDNSIFSMEIDSKGYIWLGTRNGLNKFNGKTFTSFKPNANTYGNIIGNNVTAIKEDQKGHIWALTNNGGLNKLDIDKKEFIHYNHPHLNNFPNEWPSHLLIENDSIIWIKKQHQIGIYNTKSNQFYSKKESQMAPNFIFSKKPNKHILCTGDFGIKTYQLNNTKIKSNLKYTEPVYYLDHYKNNYIVATDKGVFLFDQNFKPTKTLLNYSETTINFEPKDINTLTIDAINLWIGTSKGLYLFSKKRNQTHNTSTKLAYKYNSISLSEHSILHLKYDVFGNLWIGTASFGIYLHNKLKNQFNFISRNKTALNSALKKQINPVSAILKSNNNTIWVGTKDKGIEVYDKKRNLKNYTHFFDRNKTMQPIIGVRDLFQDSNQDIWIATANFIGKYNSKKDRIETLNHTYDWDWPYQSYVIKEFIPGTLTLTGAHFIGEINLNTGVLKKFPIKKNSILHKGIRDIEMDKNQNLWIAQNTNGLIKINKERSLYTPFKKTTSGITDNKIYALEVSDNSIWLATNSGLNLFCTDKNKVIKTFFEEDGLSSNIIYSVKLDQDKNLWMSTSKGISKLNTKTHKFTNYLLDEFFLDDAFYHNKDYTFFYGGYQDIICFKPKNIANNTTNTKTIVENFYLANKLVKIGDTIKNKVLLTNRIKNNTEIKLNHKQNTFSFSLDAYPIDYFQKHKFKYKLEGLQNDWIYENQTTILANYTTVPPGKYIFKTSVLNKDHSWSNTFNLKISIAPPFWQTNWFKLTAISCFLLSIYSFVQFRLFQLKKSKILLAQKVTEQTKALKQQNEKIKDISKKLHKADQSKLQLFTNISHEFRTPLTLILGHLENLNKNKFEHSKLIIKKNANRLLDMVNQLIEVRKIDQKQLQLKVSKFDIVSFTTNIVTSFQVLAEEKNIDLHFFSNEQKIQVWLDPEKTEKIIFNLLTNAIKYTTNNKSIYVEIQEQENEINLLVKDKGIGIPEKSLPFIFDRFYRTHHENFEGHGIGLSLVKGFIDIQHASIKATSKLGEGSVFLVTFKKGNDHFSKKELVNQQISQHQTPINPTKKSTIKTNFGYTVLIVEDNVELTNYIISLLEKTYIIKTASNGLEGLQLLKQFTPDLIISDIMMPLMDGIAFCSSVKSNIETSHIPFILLTAVTNLDTKIKGFTIGIDSYIEKPFNSDELLARISALLSNRILFKKHILTYNATNEIDKKWLNEHDAIFWKKINTLINENYTDYNFTAEKLAPLVNMSRATFYRKFKDLTGLNIAEHIRKTRLHKAKELLLNEPVAIGELGILVGFKSSSQFRTNFKNEFGETPSQFIKRLKS